MKITPINSIAFTFSEEEQKSITRVINMMDDIYHHLVYEQGANIIQSPVYGDCVTADELPRMVGILQFFANNPYANIVKDED
jgi:hypothetical protein